VPRYQYKCGHCNEILTIQHLSHESAADCIQCNEKDTLVKLLTTFSTNVKKEAKRRVGDLTEEFIQDARGDLARQKQEINEER
tara:strand:- start:37590 stop:37838 length:249 start_codon:yes stop_codon:yes gene_type:complete